MNVGSNLISLKDLDIFVLYMLLWNICSNIFKFKIGWGNFFNKGDSSILVCIERI